MDITFRFPNQVMLSLTKPDPFISLDAFQLENRDPNIDFPTATYAYTTMTPLIVHYDTPVSFEFFWIRAHRSP